MASNRFGQMAKSALPGVAGGMPPRPPKMAAPAPKAVAKPVAARPRKNLSGNLGRFLHQKKR